MSKAALLFNGIKFPFPVIDRAFAWAKQNEEALVAIFLKGKNDNKDGYKFPSDIDAAQNITDNKEALASHEALIETNIRMLVHRSAGEHIELRSVALTDPSEEQLIDELGGCEFIFVSNKIAEAAILTVDSIDLNKWLKESSISIEMIRE